MTSETLEVRREGAVVFVDITAPPMRRVRSLDRRWAQLDADHTSYRPFATLSDPDGNRWLLQEIQTRLPGREFGLDVATLTALLQETEKRPWRVRTDRAEAPLVGLVCGLHRRACARSDIRRSRRRRHASH